MKRLTYKLNDGHYCPKIVYDEETSKEKVIDMHKTFEAIDKLGMLEEIEDGLGCPIETVFKALKNGVYWILDDGMHRIDFTKNPRSLMFDGDGWFIFEGWFDIGCPIRLYLKDYGKKDGGGWALTRKELEK